MAQVTPWTKHVQKWRDCKLCSLCDQRDMIVLYKGTIPADVLLIGEAPGDSENAIGQPFVGPAGSLLMKIVERAVPTTMSVGYTNLVACYPALAKAAGTNEPSKKEIEACQPRLNELIKMCAPKLIVCVGNLAANWVDFVPDTARVEIVHPAYILRTPLAQQEMAIRKCIAQISNVVEEIPPF